MNEKWKAFQSLHTQLQQLDIKLCLFELAWMRITKDGRSQDFLTPLELRRFLDHLLAQLMDHSSQDAWADQLLHGALSATSAHNSRLHTGEHQKRDRLLDRLHGIQEGRETALQAVVTLTQEQGRDKSISQVKPSYRGLNWLPCLHGHVCLARSDFGGPLR
ncbi:hypothetical protein NDU88_001582 [Pleurodeles waltl]|uniref:Uncharacterized protein n=1 Tax=Pleurodeles waltl TaxID=8319 RepID=A0AAV7T0M2_PLEWA|nr:hypothetical protein NDU88_001582 [Pleurodeles waltl]